MNARSGCLCCALAELPGHAPDYYAIGALASAMRKSVSLCEKHVRALESCLHGWDLERLEMSQRAEKLS
jgi:hypothetical protein